MNEDVYICKSCFLTHEIIVSDWQGVMFLFAIFVVSIRGTVGMLYFMLLVQSSLTAGACRNIICDYLDHEKLLHGNYLRRG